MVTPAAETGRKPWETLQELAVRGDAERLERYVDEIGPSEAFRALLRMPPRARMQVLTQLSPAEAADLLEELPDEHAADLLEQLSAEHAVSIVNALDSDDQADVIGELDASDAEAILAKMTPEDAAEVRELIGYGRDTAGGLMATEVLSFPETTAVGTVVAELGERATAEAPHEVYVYVVSPAGKLVGVLDFRDLVLSPRDTLLATISRSPVYVTTSTPLDELQEFFNRHSFFAVPVVDERQRLCGIVHRREVRKALAERAEADYLKTQGIVGGDEIRSMPVALRSRRRLPWLSVNIGLNIIAASVIALYEDTLSAVIALAVFLPIVSDMSGCTGFQAVAVSMRELSLGIVKPNEVLRVWRQEITVGLINGLVLGILLGAAAFLWKGNPFLGLVVGAALMANTLLAVSLGGTVPLLLKRMRIDPAVASGPVLTTATDMCGFFLVLSFATLMLPYIA